MRAPTKASTAEMGGGITPSGLNGHTIDPQPRQPDLDAVDSVLHTSGHTIHQNGPQLLADEEQPLEPPKRIELSDKLTTSSIGLGVDQNQDTKYEDRREAKRQHKN